MKKQFTFGVLLFFSSLLTVLGQNTTLLPGIILPQMTTSQRMAIDSPQNGMLVFDTDTQSYWFRQSGIWVNLSSGGNSNYWHLDGIGGNEIRNTNTGGFWSANYTVVPDDGDSTTNPPTAPASGTGTRLMWIPSRSAFRVGTVSSTSPGAWDANNIGLYSFATGYGTIARGIKSTAMGYSTTASGYNSTAMGLGTTASGDYSTAMGYSNSASGIISTAMGLGTVASGYNSTAMGNNTRARGNYSVAIGTLTTASGDYSIAMGKYTNTNGKPGSFIVGDADPYLQGETIVGIDNQFVGRFANGYWLMTCGDTGNGNPSNNVRTGIRAGAGANAWSAISDSTKKEKHQLIDGEGLLRKIGKFRLTTWNYKGQDPKVFRHYGPMAQDFYAAFGKDSYGTIGCDTLINQADFDGINFAAVQALVKRTDELTRTNEELKSKNEALEQRLAKMENEWADLKQSLVRAVAGKNDADNPSSTVLMTKSSQE